MSCQAFFVAFVLIKSFNWNNESIPWLLFESLTTLFGFIAFGLDGRPQIYLKAARTLKLLLLLKINHFLAEAIKNLILSLKNQGKILIPAALLIYIYALIGIHSFSSKVLLIKTTNTTVAGLLITSLRVQTGQSTKTRCFYAVRGNAQLWMVYS